MFQKWKRLDLRGKYTAPQAEAITALRMEPKNGKATLYGSARYDIGYLKADSNEKKLWWHGSRGVDNPVRLKQHYDIWWCQVAEFDGI